jgi:hypothetical protein
MAVLTKMLQEKAANGCAHEDASGESGKWLCSRVYFRRNRQFSREISCYREDGEKV